MFWAHFPDLCFQKWNCLPWSSDAFWKFSACEFCRKSSGRNSTICSYMNEAVWLEIQTHFGSSCLASFINKVLGAFSQFMRPKGSCLPWSSDAFWKYSACKVYRKSSGRNSTICVSKNEAVCCVIQTHFESSCLASFTNKVLGAFSQFMRPKTKLFAVEFRRIPEVLWVQVKKNMLWAQFHDLCVQKRIYLPWNSDAFWKFYACEF